MINRCNNGIRAYLNVIAERETSACIDINARIIGRVAADAFLNLVPIVDC